MVWPIQFNFHLCTSIVMEYRCVWCHSLLFDIYCGQTNPWILLRHFYITTCRACILRGATFHIVKEIQFITASKSWGVSYIIKLAIGWSLFYSIGNICIRTAWCGDDSFVLRINLHQSHIITFKGVWVFCVYSHYFNFANINLKTNVISQFHKTLQLQMFIAEYWWQRMQISLPDPISFNRFKSLQPIPLLPDHDNIQQNVKC